MGRPQFAQVGTKGGGDVIAVNQRPNVKKINETQTDTVAAGNSEKVEIYAPTGSAYNLLLLDLYVGPDGDWTNGDHRLELNYGASYSVVRGISSYTDPVSWRYNKWQSATDEQNPNTENAQALAVEKLRATENQALQAIYTNNGDATQENNRSLRFVVEEVTY